MAAPKKYDVSFRLWINAGNEKVLGIGRVELLELIHKSGSISSAAKEMKMAYRQAWQMVVEMNERSNSPLVEKRIGGKSGGGAFVTEAGLKAIASFHELEEKVRALITKEAKHLEF